MNRQIKFRAWDGTRIVYLGDKRNDTALWIAEDYWEAIDHFTGEMKSLIHRTTHPNAVLMQFTGLTDKNGKEIYEGDVCCRGHLRGQVVYHNERAMFIFKDQHGFNEPLYHDAILLEVIGNIYEHSYLLNQGEGPKTCDATKDQQS
jgi:uncharacterized phage protein (TIGR01671 family)